MPIDILNPITSTYLFTLILIGAILFSLKKQKEVALLPLSVSQELKGFAMLGIILAHVGYFLANQHEFLFPLSIFAGIGVDLFLFLSGFGLTVSALKKTLAPKDFWARHLPKLFVPFWLTLASFFLLDTYLLGRTYTWQYITQSFFGFFPHANLFQDINSPLWYFSFIFFLYLLFPIFFSKKRPLLSALLIFGAINGVLLLNLSILRDTNFLYALHALAFPLGIVLGTLYSRHTKTRELIENKIAHMRAPLKIALMTLATVGICYFAYFSGIGTPVQEYTSLLTALLLVVLFILKPFRIGFFYLIGVYSYEIYLIHWPLMSRYDVLYAHLPAWLATALYIPLLIAIAWVIHHTVHFILKKNRPTS